MQAPAHRTLVQRIRAGPPGTLQRFPQAGAAPHRQGPLRGGRRGRGEVVENLHDGLQPVEQRLAVLVTDHGGLEGQRVGLVDQHFAAGADELHGVILPSGRPSLGWTGRGVVAQEGELAVLQQE